MNEPHYTTLAELQARPLPPGFETVTGPLPHNLLNDLMFRIVFETNPDALKSLLCSLLHYKDTDIAEIEIKNPIRLGKRVEDKKYVYDIYLLLNNQEKIHLELQVIHQDFWTDRSLCYLCRDFGDLNAGETYDQVKPLIQIDILDFDLYENSQEFYSTYHLANDKTGRIYSDKISLHVLELNKEEYATAEDKEYHIDYWAKLFKATTWEDLKMLATEQEALQSTVETIYRVSADEDTLLEIRAREDELRRQRTIENEMKRRAKIIEEQQTTISDQQVTLEENAATIATQNATIAEQDATIAAQETTISNQATYIAELKAQIKQLSNQ